MSVFLEILRCILCCDDEFRHGDYDETSQRDPFLQSASYDNSVRSNSARSCNHLQGQSDPKIYYQTLSSSSLAKQTPPSFNPSVSSSKPYSSFSSTTYSSKPLSSPPKASSSSTQSSSFSKPPSSSHKPSPSSTGAPPSSSNPSVSSSKPYSSFSNSTSHSSKPYSSSSFGKSLSSDQPLLSQSSSRQSPPSSKPTLSALPIHPTNQHTQANYKVIQKATSPIYMIPKNIENLIKKDIVPDVLKKPLSPTTYKDYFAALLYAEDFYTEKWSEFKLFSVTLKFHKATIYNKPPKNENLKGNDEKQDKMFVAFEVDSVPERRPFLLARDFVYARRLGSTVKQFQHHSDCKYDISFSFNRVCLKRAHQAIAAASGPLFHNYLFPDGASRKNNPPSPPNLYHNYKPGSDQTSAVHRILNFQGSPPYLVEGPLSVTESQLLSKTGIVVREAVLQIYRSSPRNRILICAPINRTCDVLIRSLRKEIPESDMFRANAAFREVDGVPIDILPLCLYEGECFSCPSVQKLRQFRVIFSTFVSSSRLHNEGITAGHFSHIFLVDDSSATEPETMIVLGNLANENTSVIVSGAPHNYSSWVRSNIARKKGLRISYFQRLRENKTYKSLEPMFITRL
ncbi:hypothetical protein Pint_23219 [Pistacia integerrima]|uniref:Uncharacterized protein n=1 Tax=Pistacia integerrima TaxID=434235 RepID=A0ACC0YMP1_9ROSI|nr:hypothetical protein Pint_23219 [Pistacia integerrima]